MVGFDIFSESNGCSIREFKDRGGLILALKIVQKAQAGDGPLLDMNRLLESRSATLNNRLEVVLEQNIQLPNRSGEFEGVRLDWLPEFLVVTRLTIVQHIPLLEENQKWTCVRMATNLVERCWRKIETSLHVGTSKGTTTNTVYDRHEF